MTRGTSVFLAFAAMLAFSAARSSAEEESSFGSYDIGPYSSGGGSFTEEEVSGDGDAQKPAEKPGKEKPVRAKRAAASFSPAFSGPQKTCPVCSSVRLKNNQYVDYSGGKIHVCSAACIGRVKRNPAAFANILVKRGEQLATP